MCYIVVPYPPEADTEAEGQCCITMRVTGWGPQVYTNHPMPNRGWGGVLWNRPKQYCKPWTTCASPVWQVAKEVLRRTLQSPQ